MNFKVGSKVKLQTKLKPPYNNLYPELKNKTLTIEDLSLREMITFGECSCATIRNRVVPLLLLKLVKEEPKLKELTFEEVIATIKEGETYEADDKTYSTQSITRKKGDILISLLEGEMCLIPTLVKYKLVPQKQKRAIYQVEHIKGGKKFDFRSDEDLYVLQLVMCDTCKGQAYGRIVDCNHEELTEDEYKAFKTIERIEL